MPFILLWQRSSYDEWCRESWFHINRSDRLFANPASTVENLFYFGFLTERLLYKTGKWFTPLLIATMYTSHEISNPEYWYGHLSFVFVFVAIAVTAAIYTWRRSVIVTWLGDGLSRFVIHLF
jgi:hypothetical protein